MYISFSKKNFQFLIIVILLIIISSPKTNLKENPNYGKVWINTKDFSISKIEIEPKSLAGFEFYEKMIILL